MFLFDLAMPPEGLAFPRGAAPRADGVGVSGRSRVRKPMGVAFPLQTLPGLGPGAGLRAHAASISTNPTQKKRRYAFLFLFHTQNAFSVNFDKSKAKEKGEMRFYHSFS